MSGNAVTADFTALGAINADKSIMFVCDIQERFRPSIAHFDRLTASAKRLIAVSKILDVPLIVTEQYPKGLGATVSELDVSTAVAIVPKTKFSMWVTEVQQAVESIANSKNIQLETVILFGVEAHVCVEQTAIDLVGRGYKVHVIADATSSRSLEDKNFALQRLQQIGCFVSTSETVIFKLIKDKDHPKFNEIKELVKNFV